MADVPTERTEPDNPNAPTDNAVRALAEALAAARPSAADDGARRLRMRAMMASVLGPDHGLPALGRWVVESKVATGGMGVVFRGRDPDSGEAVAIKLLGAEAAAERPRFSREALILRSIVHPHVVRYLDHGVEGGLDYLVMAWLDGRDLATRLARGPLAERDALRLALFVAQALEAAHRAGITHRDIKPSNIFLVGDRLDDPRLIDFGIAKSARPSHPGTRLTASGAVLGSPHYMAPEQIRGEHDPRTDIYGLGATLFECVTGRPPFVGAHPAAILLAVMAEPPPSVSALRGDVSPATDALIGRMLAKDPRDRPRDMAAVITELSGLVARPELGARVPAPISRTERERRRAPTAAASPGDVPVNVPVIGRVRELAEIDGLLAESQAEEVASVVAVTGDAGTGKSLVLTTVARRHASPSGGKPPWSIRTARAASDNAGEPFAMLRALVASAPDEPDAARDRLLQLLQPRDTLDTADALVAADRVLLAWLELLEAWTAPERGPLLFVLDDVHRADVTSLRFVDRALEHLAQRAFVVLAAGRTLDDLRALATGIDPERRLDVHLGPLRPRAAESLAEALCRDATPSLVSEVARLSGGNPAHLVELARQVRDGVAPGDGSMADLLWARLSRLDPDDRQVLRAASIIGRTVWPSAVAALLGVEPQDTRLAARLASLVAQGYLVVAPRGADDTEPRLEFASELLQLAAYDLCTEADLERGHEVVARWLVASGHAGGAVVARHLVQAGDRRGALPHFIAAVRGALAGGEPTLFDTLIAEAEACAGAATAELFAGELAELRIQGAFWRGRIDDALGIALAALDKLTPASDGWLRVTSLAITAAGQLGDNVRVRALATPLVALTPTSPAARDQRLVGLCRALTQLVLAGGQPTADLWGALDGAEPQGHDARAWLARARSTQTVQRSFDEAIALCIVAHRAHVDGGDMRSAAQVGLYLAAYLTWSGAWERARAHIDDALRLALRLGADYLVVWGRYALGRLQVEAGTYEESMALLEGVIERTASSPRIRVGAHVYAAIAAQRAGHLDVALRHAKSALAIPSGPMIARAAAAAMCRVLLAHHRGDEAATLADRLAPLPDRGAIFELDELVMLARAELALARGPHDQARAAIAEAALAIETRAATLAEPLAKNAYLARPHLIVRTFELAATTPVSDPWPRDP